MDVPQPRQWDDSRSACPGQSRQISVFAMPITLRELLDASPYLRELEQRHRAWLGSALAAPDAALRDVLDGLSAIDDRIDLVGIVTGFVTAVHRDARRARADECGLRCACVP